MQVILFKRNFNTTLRLSVFFILICGTSPLYTAEDDVKLSILAINPSASQKLETALVHYLPSEIKPEDVVDGAGMEVKFDEAKGAYYLTKQVSLEPKEARTVEIKVKNVWKVSDEDLGGIRQQLDESLKTLGGTKFSDTGQLLYDKISNELAEIEADQGKKMGMNKRIELYRAHVHQLKNIRERVGSVQAMRELELEQQGALATVKFVVVAENPSDEAKTMTVRAPLPKDVDPSHIVDKLDFSLLYDEQTNRYILEKQDQLAGKERKKYDITLRDIWSVPEVELESLANQSEVMKAHFKDTPYMDFAEQQTAFITETVQQIRELQEEVKSSPVVEERSRAFVLNSQRLNLAKKKINELQSLMIEVPPDKKVTFVQEIRQAVERLTKLLDVLKLGFRPDLSTTWWLILGIIAFLAILATSFYITWLKKLGEMKHAKSSPQATQAAA